MIAVAAISNSARNRMAVPDTELDSNKDFSKSVNCGGQHFR